MGTSSVAKRVERAPAKEVYVEARTAVVESDVAHIKTDVAETKTDIRELRGDMKTANESIASLRTEQKEAVAKLHGLIKLSIATNTIAVLVSTGAVLGIVGRALNWF